MLPRASSLLFLLLAAGVAAPGATAGVPEWLRAAARETLPAYADDTDAVLLLDEQVTTVKDSGEIKTRYRRAYKILRPDGRRYRLVTVYFDSETALTYLKAWSITANGQEYETKEKDAIETAAFNETLYEDTRHKILEIPGADPGSVVGYEFEQRRRPYVLQDRWFFQDWIPVRRAHLVLELPKSWEFSAVWQNHAEQEPRAAGENRWEWSLENIAAVEDELAMPHWRAVAGWLAVTYHPGRAGPRDKSHAAWSDVGQWYAQLAADRRQSTSEIQQKVRELTASAETPLEKMRTLASFVQREVRYVDIEIGIGGYQPHAARDVFVNRYGDCKDKVTLLSTMLREAGIESYYVLANVERGTVAAGFPSMLNFNHAILAIRVPDDTVITNLYALQEQPGLGRLLFFDPTSQVTPLGYLPSQLQGNSGLLVTPEGGELVQFPLSAPDTNRLLRTAKLSLGLAGELSGDVNEIRWGNPAVLRRVDWLGEQEAERKKSLERFLGNNLTAGFTLQSSSVENLEKLDDSLVIRYRFTAPNYAKRAGDLLLVRPRVLGQKASTVMEGKKKPDQTRQYPVEFDSASLESDLYEIAVPSGYHVDELPPPVTLDYEFASYKSTVDVEGNVIRYRRELTVKQVLIPTAQLESLKEFYRRIAADERASVVLKRAAP